MIRFILVCIVVIAYLVLTIPVLLVEWIIGKFSPMTKDISSLRMVQAIFKFILWITGAKVTVIGEENVPKDQAVLYVANHRSYFDILLTYSRCPIRTGYVAKKEMEHYPLLSNWMRNLYKIAARAKSPIIPIAISNSANIWEANFPKMTPTHVVIEYGKPIIPSELDRDTQRRLGSYTQDIIKEMLIKNKELV